MKRIFLLLTMVMLAAPAWAAVTITCTTGTNQDCDKVTVGYTFDGNNVRAFALDITVDSGATISSMEADNTVNADYDIYPGSIVIVAGAVTDDGSPICDPCDYPGVTQPGVGFGGATIEMGSLYVGLPTGPNAPAASGTLCTFRVSADCNVTVAENTARAGIVMEDPDEDPSDNLPVGPVLVSGLPCPECMKATHPDYTAWGTAGKPDCWCYKRQCRGDGDGVWTGPFPVGSPDLDAFRLAFGQHISTFAANPGWWCSNYDRLLTGPFPVGSPDLDIFRIYFGGHFTTVPECDGTHINYWIL